MKVLRNDRGIALVMVLVLSGIALAIMAGLIYMATSGTQVSGLQKRYKTAVEGDMAGAEMMYKIIGNRGKLSGLTGLPITYTAADTCLFAKITQQTSSTNDWNSCSSGNLAKATSLTIIPADATKPEGDKDTYDFRLDLGTDPYKYTVYAKITETIEGNTAPDGGWVQGGVVWSKSEFYPVPRPYYYGIEIHAEKLGTPERAKLSILYQH